MASRTQNSLKNIFTGLAGKIIVFLFAFATKTAFARLLGAEYSGVDGLYANILTVLSMADLGINNVFTYFLYQGLAEKDEERTAALVASFRKLYWGVGLAVLAIGFLVVPLLPWIVNSDLPQREIVLYYILYLLNAAASYFFIYKTTVLTADQKQYITNICGTIFQIVLYAAQLTYLLLTGDFTGYLVIQVLCTVGQNVTLSIIAEKKYPYLKKKASSKAYPLKRGVLWNNVKATFVYKFCGIIINYTDNILISILIGTVYVGKYAYYTLLLQYISAYITLFGNGILASIGNLNSGEDKEKSYHFFRTLNLIYALITITVICAFANCIQQFIPIWIGDEFELSSLSVVAMLLVMYLNTMACPVAMYRETMGLFREVQYILLPSAIINIVLSVVLGLLIGLPGILFATCIAKLATNLWYEPIVVYKKFGKSVRSYFLLQASFAGSGLLCLAVTMLICRLLPETLIGVIIRAICTMTVTILILWLIYRRTEMGRDLKDRVGSLIRARRKR